MILMEIKQEERRQKAKGKRQKAKESKW